mmetsp:Transcript_56819/g.83371  ORF Transcript_56819/g.83371 Transcript_56819/m.83371 type:complete len:99 (-) Transcript_56819:80-376(-)
MVWSRDCIQNSVLYAQLAAVIVAVLGGTHLSPAALFWAENVPQGFQTQLVTLRSSNLCVFARDLVLRQTELRMLQCVMWSRENGSFLQLSWNDNFLEN